MISRLNLAIGVGMILCVLISLGMLIGALLLAYRWEWLHPAVATTVVIILGIGLSQVSVKLAWIIGNSKDPYRGGYG